jgi:NAD-dependent deacetylase
VLAAKPNAAHRALVELESHFDTWIITQNIDDLHERAGSTRVVHLHGEIRKAQSSLDPTLVYDLDGSELREGMLCERGSQLRPHVVWFGEPVPMMGPATALTERAARFVVIGTSLVVYPAASLLECVPENAPITLIDPSADRIACPRSVQRIAKKATAGVPEFVAELCGGAGR